MIHFTLYDDTDFVYDPTAHVVDVSIGSGEHGFEELTLDVRLSDARALRWIHDLRVYRLLAVDQWGIEAWEGRIEDVQGIDAGVRFVARGDFAGFGDVVIQSVGGTVSAEQITRDVVDEVADVNPVSITKNSTLIDIADLPEAATFADKPAISILNALASMRVWERRAVQAGQAGRVFVVEVGAVEFGRTIDPVINAAYATYDSGTTAWTTDTLSIAQFGVERQTVIEVDTTDPATAEQQRDNAIQTSAPLSVDLDIQRLLTPDGKQLPATILRAGDTILLRHLATIQPVTDRLEIEETELGIDGALRVSVRVPKLETQVLRALTR